MTNTHTAAVRTIGSDKGYGDIFKAVVRYEDGTTGVIVVYGGNLQATGGLLREFAPIWKFETLRISRAHWAAVMALFRDG